MRRDRWRSALLALAFGAAGNAQPSGAAEFLCSNGDLARRVELREGSPTQGCEVRYWRNAGSGSGQSLWRAERDPDYCAVRARELIARLETGGWTCTAGERAIQAGAGPATETAPALPAAAPTQVTRALAPPDPTPAAAPAPPAASSAKPPAPDVARPTPPASATEPPPSVATQTAPAASSAKPPSPILAPPSADGAAASSAHATAARLNRVVEETLRSVQELYGGQFQAELAAFGDLDADGLDDAAVLVTYQADRQEYLQYLVAYLYNGETFQSVATRNIGGRFLDAVRAELQGIADGRILVELEALAGGATCCARRRTAFALDNGRLIEVDAPGASGPERTTQTEWSPPG
jgi:hypothetical protein